MALKVPSPYEKALAERQALYAEHVDKLRQLAGIDVGLVRSTATNRFGDQLPLFAQAAVVALHGAPRAYAALPFDAAQLSADSRALTDLLLFKGFVEQLAADTSAACQAKGAEVARSVGLVIKATDTTLENPGLEQGLKTQTANASGPLRELNGKRNETIKVAMASTKTQRMNDAGTESENSRLRLENRFLAGEPLKPTDLAPPSAPRAKRRRSRR